MTEIILTSSVLILLLAILRRVLRGRISPCVQYALWLLAAARLLIPGTLFTAPVSVAGAAEHLQTSILLAEPAETPAAALPAETPDLPAEVPNPSGGGPAADAAIQTANDSSAALAALPANGFAMKPPVFRAEDILDGIWKAGIAVTGSAMAVSNLILSFRLRKRRKPMASPAVPWSGNLPVYEAEGLPSPCLFGLFRPAIYLNEAAIKAEHPEHILAHEYAHYRHGDHLWSVLRSVCLAVHWYNPLVWWAAALSRRDCELACDAAALERLGETKRIDYGQTLLGMVSKRTSPAALFHTATTMTAGKRAMTERIALIVKQPKMRKITLALVAALALLLGACAFAGAADKEAPEQTAALMEYPGLHWNDTPEAVMAALGVTEKDFLSTMKQGTPDVDKHLAYEFTLENPSFDPEAQFAVFHFSQYRGTGHEMGLDMVSLCYPEDMENFDALREGFVRQYGPGVEEDNDPYTADMIRRSLTDTYIKREIDAAVGRDRLARWDELMEQAGPHCFSWEIHVDDLPREQAEAFAAFYQAQDGWYVYPGLWSEHVPEYPFMARVTWSDRSLENYTFNQITYDARNYVAFLQPACPVVLPTVSSLVEFPGLHWNDSVETVMETLGITDEDVKSGNGDGSDGQVFHFILNDVPLYGSTAYSAIFRFIRYPGQERLGLYAVEASYSNAAGEFDAVLDGLKQRYGQETKSTNVVHEVTQAKKDFMGDQAGEWEELQKQTGVNTIYWESGPATLPEGFTQLPQDAFSSWRIFYSEDARYDPMPISRVTWSSNSMFTQSFNTVIFDGGGYVYCLQNPSAGGADWKNRHIIEQVRKGADPSEWLDCIQGLDWAGFREAAGDMGLDGTEMERAVLEAIFRSVEQNDLTAGQIMYILTAGDGLTAFVRGDEAGTPEAVYRDIVSEMHAKDPPLFAFALLAKTPETYRDAALNAFRYAASKEGRVLSREEAVGQLENDLKSNPSANPTEIVLTRKGETGRFLPDTVYGADSAAYSSYDSSIASVTDGIITAVSPGETNITLVTNDEAAHTFTCHVRCEW